MNEATTVRRNNPITQLLTHKLFIVLLRIALGGIFIYSSLDKIQNPHLFGAAVRSYELLPLAVTNLFGLFVAWGELLAGIMLLLGVRTRSAAGAIFILLVMFTVAIITTLIRGIAIDCGCFSNEGGSTTSYTLVIRNLFLMAGAAIVMRFDTGFLTVGGLLDRRKRS